MPEKSKLKILMLLSLIIISGCENNNLKIHCIYETISSDTLQRIFINECKCYYRPSGNMYSIATKKGLSNINEEIYYYPNGKIKQYAFYNPDGEQRFLRVYDEKGILKDEYGDFYCYVKINKREITMRDSIILDFYISSPPDTYYKIFWIDVEGRHEIDRADTIAPYQRRLTIIPKKTGNYILPHEVEFYDIIQNTKEIRKYDISFDVIDR